DRIEAPRLLADFRHGRDQLDVLPRAVARHGPGLGSVHAGGLRLRRESPADGDPRSVTRSRQGGGQGPARLLRTHATSAGRGKARPPPLATPSAASFLGSDDLSVPLHSPTL